MSLHRLLPPHRISIRILLLARSQSTAAAAFPAAQDRRKTPPSAAQSPPSSPHFSSAAATWKHSDEENRAVKVSVWWDFENCAVPAGANAYRISQNIVAALRANGIKGPVSIAAFGNVTCLSWGIQEALSDTGVCLKHVPQNGKNCADRSLILDLFQWTNHNPPPAHIFLISGDKDFSSVLHRLRMSNYNVLLATKDVSSGVLCSAASIMWQWNGLARGDMIPGKHFNHPPDGLNSSWYGHYKGPLEDPFLVLEAENSAERGTEIKPRPIPKVVVKHIEQILNSYPDGLRISTLRQEMVKNNVSIDKDFFGHKKFTKFLSALPHILKIQADSSLEGESWVFKIEANSNELYSSNEKTSTTVKGNKQPDLSATDRPATEKDPIVRRMDKADALYSVASETLNDMAKQPDLPIAEKDPAVRRINRTEALKSVPSGALKGTAKQPNLPVTGKVPVVARIDKAEAFKSVSELKQPSKEEDASREEDAHTTLISQSSRTNAEGGGGSELSQESQQCRTSDDESRTQVSAEEGFFRRTWKTWFSQKLDNSDKNLKSENDTKINIFRPENSENLESSGYFSLLRNIFNRNFLQSGQQRSNMEGNNNPSPIKNEEKSVPRASFFGKLLKSFSRSKPEKDQVDVIPGSERSDKNQSDCTVNAVDTNKFDEVILSEGHHEQFSNKSFWDELESFLSSQKGFAVVCRSITRQQLAQELLKEGPLVLKSFEKVHLNCLVDLLITEKKWLEESSYLFPFKLSRPDRNGSLPSKRELNGLSTIFGKSATSNVQKLREIKQNSMPELSISGSSWPKVPENLSELKSWSRKYFGADAVTSDDFKKQYVLDFGKKLDPSVYGFSDVENLLGAWLPTNSSSSKIAKSASGRTRDQILDDCKKLITELFKLHPNGFNMGSFKPLFYERYGYFLDNQMLGYQKLASLIQIIPGIKVESAFIVPASKIPKGDPSIQTPVSHSKAENREDSRSHCDVSRSEFSGREIDQDDDLVQDADWAELGPISSRKSVVECGESHIPANAETEGHVASSEVELLADQYVSDSDDEMLSTDIGPKKGVSDTESSLVNLLESWYSQNDSKADSDSNQLPRLDGFVDYAGSSASSLVSGEPTKSKTSIGCTSHLRKTTKNKKICFCVRIEECFRL